MYPYLSKVYIIFTLLLALISNKVTLNNHLNSNKNLYSKFTNEKRT